MTTGTYDHLRVLFGVDARAPRYALDHGDTFEYHGYTFKVEFPRDDDHGEPWVESYGHGEVSDWRRNDRTTGRPSKAPGERVLCTDRDSARYYDFASAVKTAREDQWGCKHSYTYNLGRRVFVSGHTTAGELAQCAAESDFEYLRRWCADHWWYIGVVVTLIEVDEDDREIETSERASLWGIESDASSYRETVAHVLADEIISRLEVDEPQAQLSEN